ncbi:hypothetical protein [Actinomycetospora sp. NBRC 106378]|uniref:hypothetical protein n=1 Tax=Actinomycetospora sp. NBRC 106378 TaxID=3032208 RepID=UPI0024A2E667|nr:hypothetical protein [Actinomycetospora sp. NBRC 106378]GLZ54660.1 hypothetical protein Acsp07_42770 [Actinomycetospora sp. NBRC 106378]
MSQETPHRSGPGPDERDGGAVRDRSPHGAPRHAPHPRQPVPPMPPMPPMAPPPGMPRQAPPGYGYRAYPPPTGGWAPIGVDDDAEDPRTPGNPAASFSAVLGVLALLVGLRPLAFGSMALSWDGFVGIGIALVALVAGAVGLRTSVRRPVAAVGMVLAVVALLVVAVLPTF